jgi:hypothetical protein
MSTAALLVLVGPSEDDILRLADLLDSVACYEPDLVDCVLIDDAAEDRTARIASLAAGRLPVTVRRHPRRGKRARRAGALTAGVLTGLASVHERIDVEFVLKIDLDALVIAPFQQQISAFLRAHPDAGVVGCIGDTCDRSIAGHQRRLRGAAPFAVALELLDALPSERVAALQTISVAHPAMGTVEITAEQYQAALALRPRMAQAAANGQRTADYCQGGAYAISAELIRRMKAASMLDDALLWLPLGLFGEDEVLTMYSFAAGLQLYDFSNDREPFGICWRGLPFEPAELLARGYALIHSVKQDDRHTEADIRAFFAQRRSAPRLRHSYS